jgi:superfamily II DNA or RNA helicase
MKTLLSTVLLFKEMSICVSIRDIQEKDVQTMEKKLVLHLEPKQRSKKKANVSWRPIEHINIVRREEENVLVPFAWGVSYFGHKYRTPRQECRPLVSRFNGKLRSEQKEIFSETVDYLNRSGSCLMAVYPGGGKCLGRGTQIRLFDGSVRCVEDIRRGDRLQGDCHHPKTVLSTCRGRQTMYRIGRQGTHLLDYRVNESHILSVFDRINHNVVDMSVLELLRMDPHLTRFEGIYLDYDHETFCLEEERLKMKKICTTEGRQLESQHVTTVMLCGFYWVPCEKGIEIIDLDLICKSPRQRVVQTYRLSIEKQNVDEYFGFTLDGNGRFLLHNGILTHNTITSLCIASTIRLTTMIFVNKLVLIDQWLETIYKCFGQETRVQVIEGRKCTLQLGCDFYIVNAINVKKHPFELYKNLGIGLLLVDECHLLMTRIFSQALSFIRPRYMIGLSATPFRIDGYDILLELYFGLHRVVRKLHRSHTVYHIDSKIKIEHERDVRGDILWHSVIEKQTTHVKRNEMIADICRKYSTRNILVLSKRLCQIEHIANLLRDQHVTVMKENENTFDENARILIATFQKVGTGFSHDKLDMLVLASDTEEYFIQYLGRVFRRPDVQPIVIDIVDQHPILKRHFHTRKRVYEEAGGTIVCSSIENHS